MPAVPMPSQMFIGVGGAGVGGGVGGIGVGGAGVPPAESSNVVRVTGDGGDEGDAATEIVTELTELMSAGAVHVMSEAAPPESL